MAGELRKYTPVLVTVIIGLLAGAAIWGAAGSGEAESSSAERDSQPKPAMSAGGKRYVAPPPMTIDLDKRYLARFQTSRGMIVCELFAKDAPITVNNFVFLANEKFYDGTVFHRVISDFMIQGGDPTASGSGGPGYRFEDEVGPGKPRFKTGSLAMANAGAHTNGSQFFITHKPTDWLQGKHTIFGQVIEGQDVVDAVRQGDTLESVTIEVIDSTTTQPSES